MMNVRVVCGIWLAFSVSSAKGIEINCFESEDSIVAQLGAVGGPVTDVRLTYTDPSALSDFGGVANLMSGLAALERQGCLSSIKKMSVDNLTFDNTSFVKIGSAGCLEDLSIEEADLDDCDDYQPLAALTSLKSFKMRDSSFDEQDYPALFAGNVAGPLQIRFQSFLGVLGQIASLENLKIVDESIFPSSMASRRGRPGRAARAYEAWRANQVRQCAVTLASLGLRRLSLKDVNLGPIFVGAFNLPARHKYKKVNFSRNSVFLNEAADFIVRHKDSDLSVKFQDGSYRRADLCDAVIEQLVKVDFN